MKLGCDWRQGPKQKFSKVVQVLVSAQMQWRHNTSCDKRYLTEDFLRLYNSTSFLAAIGKTPRKPRAMRIEGESTSPRVST